MMNLSKRSHSNGEVPYKMVLQPVGVIKNKLKEPFLTAVDSGIELQGQIEAIRKEIRKSNQEISEIVINKDIIDIFDGIEQYSHLVVLYWAHKVPNKSRLLTRVHPMGRKEIPMVGIFCTCSPARPNPVLMSVVRLRGIKGNVLQVTGLDAVDGSPVIDIKPYVKEFYPQEKVFIPEWMQKLQQELGDSRKFGTLKK
jgi:tRNA-Thr(GGU) m(6)t(6)A37 methyltransferase TsaA